MAALLHDVCYFTGDITGICSDLQVINSDEVKLILLGKSGLGFQGCLRCPWPTQYSLNPNDLLNEELYPIEKPSGNNAPSTYAEIDGYARYLHICLGPIPLFRVTDGYPAQSCVSAQAEEIDHLREALRITREQIKHGIEVDPEMVWGLIRAILILNNFEGIHYGR